MKKVLMAAIALLLSVGLVGHYSAPVEAFTGVNELASVDSSENQGNGHSHRYPSISQAGRYVVFQSSATNLVGSDTNGYADIFLRDRTAGTTTRVSVSFSGVQANGTSYDPRISESGKYVVYASDATNLIDGSTLSSGFQQIFMYNVSAGTTSFISQSTTGGVADAGAGMPDVNTDGRFVSFQSNSTNLISGGASGTFSEVYVRDTVLDTTRRIASGNNNSVEPRIDCSGRFVAFTSQASNLVAGDTNGNTDIFLADTLNGTVLKDLTPSGNDSSVRPAISCNGGYVSFESAASNLIGSDANSKNDVFRYDRLSDTTNIVSSATGGTQGNNHSSYADISGDGRYVSYQSEATNLVAGDTNAKTDVFLTDVTDGTTGLVAGASGSQANANNVSPAISADGKYVAYQSGATNLATDTNGKDDIFISTTGEEACTF